ncbi:Crp/Fnr family transcriptional regulator [Phenylobacterium soli]|uniref:Crp/Fnr family transcriptional regulator n=1 Tax=Phenylobacterium soli TaxID=2170551 RepID=A0A328AKT1_9CAUL|nr:Crp/Fnr family transcriptional regulator [Phenylobacterium soli]RAK55005.1 Crp/Fnr family transcriptional regulator [Phenylobacterium soli]
MGVRPLDPVLRRVRSLGAIPENEIELIRSLSERRERHYPGEQLAAEGDAGSRPRFVVSGWACRQRLMPDGRRQIFSLLLPGDCLGFGGRPPLAGIVALTALETIDASGVHEILRRGLAPGLARAVAAADTIEDALLLDHAVRLGRLTALERVAHFLLELQQRLEIVGLGDHQRFPLPLTQEMLADTLGLSIVHVNRTLQQLRRAALIELRSGVAILLQPEALAKLCDYRGTAAVPANRAA